MHLLKSLSIILLLMLPPGATLANAVIRVDPNTPAAASAKAELIIENDPRLDQKITYNGSYKRLHAVVDDLSQMTGVAIYGGLSSKNWQVRDIPIVVCVKDLPLGKVLQAVADAAHLRLSSRKIEEQGKVTWTYRLSRSVKDEIEIDTVLERKHDSELAVGSWAWDAMRICGQQPEREGVDKETMLISRLIASLGDDCRQKLMAYDTFAFKADDPKYRDIVRELYIMTWNNRAQNTARRGRTPIQPNEADIDAATLTVKLVDSSIIRNLTPLAVKNTSDEIIECYPGYADLDDDAHKLLGIKGLDLPPFPEDVAPPSAAADMADPEMSLLDTDEQWKRPALNKPFDLKKPEGNPPMFADLIQDLSGATGFSIVCEDFLSHTGDNCQTWVPMKYKDADTLRSALQESDCKWFINETENLLVGWEHGADWRLNHRSLVPEDYLLSLRKKMDNEGVNIDDAAAFASLTERQFGVWVSASRDLDRLSQGRTGDVAMWTLYDRLKPEDKALAKSEEGLPLAKLDPQWIRAAFLEQKRMRSNRIMSAYSDRREDKERETDRQRLETMTDPSTISTTVLHLIKQPTVYSILYEGRPAYSTVPTDEGLPVNKYELEIQYGEDGRDKLSYGGPGLDFPVYSTKREAEILKALKQNTTR